MAAGFCRLQGVGLSRSNVSTTQEPRLILAPACGCASTRSKPVDSKRMPWQVLDTECSLRALVAQYKFYRESPVYRTPLCFRWYCVCLNYAYLLLRYYATTMIEVMSEPSASFPSAESLSTSIYVWVYLPDAASVRVLNCISLRVLPWANT